MSAFVQLVLNTWMAIPMFCSILESTRFVAKCEGYAGKTEQNCDKGALDPGVLLIPFWGWFEGDGFKGD